MPFHNDCQAGESILDEEGCLCRNSSYVGRLVQRDTTWSDGIRWAVVLVWVLCQSAWTWTAHSLRWHSSYPPRMEWILRNSRMWPSRHEPRYNGEEMNILSLVSYMLKMSQSTVGYWTMLPDQRALSFQKARPIRGLWLRTVGILETLPMSHVVANLVCSIEV